jgi:hypothetical protein
MHLNVKILKINKNLFNIHHGDNTVKPNAILDIGDSKGHRIPRRIGAISNMIGILPKRVKGGFNLPNLVFLIRLPVLGHRSGEDSK